MLCIFAMSFDSQIGAQNLKQTFQTVGTCILVEVLIKCRYWYVENDRVHDREV